MKRKIQHIYGWIEQNEAAYGIRRWTFTEPVEVDVSGSGGVELDMSDLFQSGACFEGESDTIWSSILDGDARCFTTFALAKREALAEWREKRDVAVRALQHLRKQQVGSCAT